MSLKLALANLLLTILKNYLSLVSTIINPITILISFIIGGLLYLYKHQRIFLIIPMFLFFMYFSLLIAVYLTWDSAF